MEIKNLTPDFNPTLTINFDGKELRLFKEFIDNHLKVMKYDLEQDNNEFLRAYLKRNKTDKDFNYLDDKANEYLKNKRILNMLEFVSETITEKYISI